MPVLLFIIFILLPLAELYVIIQVGQAIGFWLTLALLLADGFIGAALARSQGRAVWRRFNQAMSEGRAPAREVFDGAMVVFGGALLLSPGFLSDVLGIGLLLPPGRALIRRIVGRAAKRTPAGRPIFFAYERFGSPGSSSSSGSAGGRRAGTGEVPRSERRQPRPGPQPGGSRPGGSRPYDVEGTAQEVNPDGPELEDGRDRDA